MQDITPAARQMYDQLSAELQTLIRAWRYMFELTNDQFMSATFKRVSEPFFGTVIQR